MTVLLQTVDQVLGSSTTEGPRLSFQVGTVSAREIIRARVQMEVDRYNSGERPSYLVELVPPPQAEQDLNGPLRDCRRPLDLERQIAVALEAVRKGRIIILFNGKQVGDIDAPLLVTPVSEAGFLKLFPLVGG
jgi:hypothetical protein